MKNSSDSVKSEDFFSNYSEPDLVRAINLTRRYLIKISYNAADIDDAITDAFLKLANGERRWEPKRFTLEQHLIYIARSALSHRIAKEANHYSYDVYEELLSYDQIHSTSPILNPEEVCEFSENLHSMVDFITDTGDVTVINIVDYLLSEGPFKKNAGYC